MKDYYEILGVDKNATEQEIKKAFRKKAHQYHPDKKNGNEAKFKQVNEAYQVLSNPQKRKQYDQFGSGFNQQTGSGQGFSGFDFDFDFGQAETGFSQFSGGAFDLGDIFKDFFNQAFKRGSDVGLDIEIDFKEAILGTFREINVPQGKLNIEIPPGIESGQRVKVAGQGEPGQSGYAPGDLYVRIYVKEDPNFKRENNDIVYQQDISFTQAALGDKIKVPTLEGEQEVKIPPGIQNKGRIRLKGKGVPGKGDQIIEVNVKVPRRLSRKQKQILKELDL